MTQKHLIALFDKHNEEFLEFERVENKLSKRHDVHAIILLDKLCPSGMDMICGARHDLIFFSPELKDLARVITEEQVLELIRSGVRLDGHCLEMFV